ncbi:MAG: putative YigZ family protein [Cyclobacteriaceae bacterium]|jgi:uncharacterized YigZ family protein
MDEVIFHTIISAGEGFYKEKGSKFFAYAFPVSTEGDVKIAQDELRKKHHDARHHCYAFRLGMTQQVVRANDDGEPNHSAGDPILGQIKSFGLTDVLVIVVRYFGGTKLGVGGLIHAYKTASEEALKGLVQKEIYETTSFQLLYTYEETPQIERLLQQFPIEIIERSFESSCLLCGRIRATLFEGLQASCIDAQLRLK